MIEKTFLRLQHSEGTICTMASQLLSAFIISGQLTPANENELVERSAVLAIQLAQKIDRAVESDDENDDR